MDSRKKDDTLWLNTPSLRTSGVVVLSTIDALKNNCRIHIVMSVRADGRTAHQLRALASESRALNRADGSARFAFGGSAALCGVHGPLACASTRDELPDRALLDVQCAPPTGRVGYVASAFISRLAARDRSDVTAQSSFCFLVYLCVHESIQTQLCACCIYCVEWGRVSIATHLSSLLFCCCCRFDSYNDYNSYTIA